VAAQERPALSVARRPEIWSLGKLGELLRLNRDLFGRTVLLMTATVLLTRTGAQQGAVVLAANAILFQLFMLSALLLDGYENAGQVLCGEALGAGRRGEFQRLVRALLAWGAATALVISLAYLAAGASLAASFSTAPDVVAAARSYIVWVVVLPLAGVASFVFDGVFIGCSWTRAMLLSMAAALAGFVGLLVLTGPLGNHGLWLAFSLFFVLRAAGQAVQLPGLVRRSFAAASP